MFVVRCLSMTDRPVTSNSRFEMVRGSEVSRISRSWNLERSSFHLIEDLRKGLPRNTPIGVGKENQEYLRVFFWMWFNWIHLGGFKLGRPGHPGLDIWIHERHQTLSIFVENGRMAPQTTLVSNRTMSQWSHSLRVYRWLWDNYGLWFMDVFAGFKYIYMVNGVYKLSYNWGASPCMASNLPYFIDLCDIWGTKILNWKVVIRLGMALRNQLNRSFIYIHSPNLWPLFNLRSKSLGWQVFILYLPFGYGSVGPRNSMIMMIEFIGILYTKIICIYITIYI